MSRAVAKPEMEAIPATVIAATVAVSRHMAEALGFDPAPHTPRGAGGG